MADEDSLSDTLDDQINVSLLPETDGQSKRIFQCFTLHRRKAAIFAVIAALLLLVVVLLAVFLRSSSSAASKQDKKHPIRQSLRLPTHLSPIEYSVYLHPNLTTFKYSGKVKVLLYCNKAANNVTLHSGKKINYNGRVKVAYIPDLNDMQTKQPLGVKKTSRLAGEMMWIELESELQSGKYYLLIIEFDSELSRGLAGFYLSTYKSPSGETR